MLDKDPRNIQAMFARIAHRYDLANRILSARSDLAWRKRVGQTLLDSPGLVLDIASGTGDLTVALAQTGRHKVVSADFTFEMLREGRAKLRRVTPSPAQIAADALFLPFRNGAFDGVTVAFGIRNFVDAASGLQEMTRVTRSGGTVGVLEFSRPHPLLDFVFRWYFRTLLPRIGGLITGSRASYEYLPRSVGEFPEGDAFLALMAGAGLTQLGASRLSGGIATFYVGVKP